MPTYAYQCQACAHAFDAFQKFSDDPLTVCPACEGPIHRVIHPTPVVFKGSGWYITDSKSAGKGAEAAKKDDGGDAKPDAATSEKPEKVEKTDKPAATAEKTDKAKPDKAKPVAASAD